MVQRCTFVFDNVNAICVFSVGKESHTLYSVFLATDTAMSVIWWSWWEYRPNPFNFNRLHLDLCQASIMTESESSDIENT